ncbi:CHAD domain-containing protein [Streptacidiphilus sp. 4-A2]|nr:CHAD domain-containing protein [Streptacidiphilus sp. 4-A2]
MLTEQLRAEVAAVLTLDAAVRRDRPDAVHRMRIAVRRLRSTLRTHRRTLGRAAVEPLTAELRWLGGALSAARDSEVVGELLAGQLSELPKAERPGPMRRRIAAWSAEHHRREREHVLAVLDGARYFGLLAALDGLAADPVPPARAGRRPAPSCAGYCGASSAGWPSGWQSPGGCRRARPATRRCTRPARPPSGPGTRARARSRCTAAGRVASPAGWRHSRSCWAGARTRCCARAELPGIAAAAHAHGEPGFGYGVLFAAQAAVLAGCDAELPAVSAAARRPG